MINENEIKYDIEKINPQVIFGEKPSLFRMHKPKIDLKRCDKKYRCIVYCPQNAIATGKDLNPVINFEKCDGCLICLRECPSSAIEEDAQ